MTDSKRLKEAFDRIEKSPAAPWVREINERYRKTGTYRARDIRRVMGDPKEGVKVASDPTLAALRAAL